VLGGVRVGILSPAGHDSRLERQRRILINLHGGGFFYNRGLVAGQLESIPVAATSQTTVLTLDYRQAPFFRHPAGSEDVEAVYTQLLEHHRPESIGIYGCSAGAALASQAVARFASRGIPRPGAIGLFSMAPPPPFGLVAPWGDGWGDSGVWFAGAPKNQPSPAERVLCEMMQWYMEASPLCDTTAYPGNSNEVLAGFPPTLFLSGTRDFASSTVIAAHARFLKLGVEASLYLMEGAPHAAHVYGVGTPEAHEAHRYVAHWFNKHLAE
jgi:monoterpene epsilon-lactone hydrolase